MVVETIKQEAQRFLANMPEDKIFWVNGGQVIRNMKELAEGLKNMPEETYTYHVNEQKNDFVNWVKDVIRDETLARDLRKASGRAQAARAVANRVSLLSKRL